MLSHRLCAVLHFAAAQLNMIPTATITKRVPGSTPYSMLFGLKPRFEWLRSYGDEAYIHDPSLGLSWGRRAFLKSIQFGNPDEGMEFAIENTGQTTVVHTATFVDEWGHGTPPGTAESHPGQGVTPTLPSPAPWLPLPDQPYLSDGGSDDEWDLEYPPLQRSITETAQATDGDPDNHAQVEGPQNEVIQPDVAHHDPPSSQAELQTTEEDAAQTNDAHTGNQNELEDGQQQSTDHGLAESSDSEEELPALLRRSTCTRAPPQRYGLLCIDDKHVSNPYIAKHVSSQAAQRAIKRIQQESKATTWLIRPDGTQTSILNIGAYTDETIDDSPNAWLSSAPGKIGVLDLYSGSGSIRRALIEAHVDHLFKVISVDTDPDTNPTLLMSVVQLAEDLRSGRTPEVLRHLDIQMIWASPPCTPFSAANTSRTRDEKTTQLREGEKLVTACMDIIEMLQPKAWAIENPDSGPNRLAIREITKGIQSTARTATCCHYGREAKNARLRSSSQT